eukprot:RCo049465
MGGSSGIDACCFVCPYSQPPSHCPVLGCVINCERVVCSHRPSHRPNAMLLEIGVGGHFSCIYGAFAPCAADGLFLSSGRKVMHCFRISPSGIGQPDVRILLRMSAQQPFVNPPPSPFPGCS